MPALREAPVWIELNGARRVLLSCSPHDAHALALGHLLAEGWIRSHADVLALVEAEESHGTFGIRAQVNGGAVAAADALRAHQLQCGCGARHFLECEPLSPQPRDTAPAAALSELFRQLFHAADHESPEGGVHAVGLCAGGTLRYVSIDVARHSAADRAIGYALLAGADVRAHGLVSTARISAALALKAARTGLGWIASRSVGTSLAHELAAAAGIPLIERAARRSPG